MIAYRISHQESVDHRIDRRLVVALVGGWIYGWSWLDPAMGLVGAVLVAVWAKGLIGDTAKVLLDRDLPDRLASIAHEAEVSTSQLVLEITETGLMTHEAEIVETLEELRSAGIGLIIDDENPLLSLTYDRIFRLL